MAVEFYKALWGMEGSLSEQLTLIKGAEYDGFESGMGHIPAADLRQIVGDHGLKFITQHFIEDPADLAPQLAHSVEAGAVKAVVHAGKDWWSFDRGCTFFEGALRIVEDARLPVCFETHRGRLLFTPSSAAEYLCRFPELRLTADFSHWVVVCESMLSDQADSLSLAIGRTGHLHSRVGHEQSPQVSDARVAPWIEYVEKYELWWDAIHSAHVARGETLTVDPEFGPPRYQPTHPITEEPLSNVWDVSLWLRDRLKSRWA